MLKQSNTFLKWILIPLYLLPFAGILYVVARYSLNVPKWDDYDMLTFLLKWRSNPTIAESIDLLFTQVNEHRAAFHKLIVLTQVALTGHINFRWLMVIGNLALLATALLLLRQGRGSAKHMWSFIPVAYFIFTPQHHENMLLSEGSTANHFVLLFSLTTLILAAGKQAYHFMLCMVTVVVCTYTNANGMFVFLPLFIHLAFERRWRHLLTSLVVAAFTLGWYFYDYSSPPGHPPLLDAIFAYPLKTLAYYFSFCGSMFSLGGPSALIAGIALWLSLLVLFFAMKTHRSHPALFHFLLFLHITAAVTAVGRSWLGIEQAVVSRYRLYSCLTFGTTLYLFLLFIESKKVWLPLTLSASLASLCFAGWSWTYPMPDIKGEHDRMADGFKLWIRNNPELTYQPGMRNDGLYYYVDDYKVTPFRSLPDALQTGIYLLPDTSKFESTLR